MVTVVVRTAVGTDGPRRRRIRTVVLAESDVDIRDLVQIVLEGLDATVRTADSGDTALEVCRQHHPDTLLIDRLVPGLSAVEVVRAIRADPALRDMYVLAMSGRATAAEAEELLAAGADDYVIKPFGPIELRGFFEGDPDDDPRGW